MNSQYAVSVMGRGVLGLMTLVLVASCQPAVQEIEEPQAVLEQISQAMRDFHIANEIYYSEHGRYTSDLDELEDYGVLRMDSVDLRVSVAEDGQGLSSIGVHRRTGPDVGCVFVWGSATVRSTPGGRSHDGSNQLVCDAAFDGVEDRAGVADPPT